MTAPPSHKREVIVYLVSGQVGQGGQAQGAVVVPPAPVPYRAAVGFQAGAIFIAARSGGGVNFLAGLLFHGRADPGAIGMGSVTTPPAPVPVAAGGHGHGAPQWGQGGVVVPPAPVPVVPPVLLSVADGGGGVVVVVVVVVVGPPAPVPWVVPVVASGTACFCMVLSVVPPAPLPVADGDGVVVVVVVVPPAPMLWVAPALSICWSVVVPPVPVP